MLDNPEALFLVIPILLFSIIIHEMAHGYAALFLGDPTARNMGRLTLNPLVHLDPIWSVAVPIMTMMVGGFFFGMAKPIIYNPHNLRDKKWGEAKVAAAGPASNIVIALFFVLLIRLLEWFSFANYMVYQALFLVVVMNIFLAVFNLIPIAPLDGSKILFSFLKPRHLYIRRFMEQYSMFMMIVLLVIILNTNIVGDVVLQLSDWLI